MQGFLSDRLPYRVMEGLVQMGILDKAIYQSDCLRLLERLPDKSISLIYLDPPWDVASRGWKSKNGRYRDNAIGEYFYFLLKVVWQSRRILTDNGNFYIHVTPSAGAAIREFRPKLDEIFRASNYQHEIVLPRRKRVVINPNRPQTTHEAILHYSKSEKFTYNRLYDRSESRALEHHFQRDENGRLYKTVDLLAPFARPQLQFEWKGIRPPEGRGWRYNAEKLIELDAQGDILWSSKGRPRQKFYLDDHPIDITDTWDEVIDLPRNEQIPDFIGQQPIALLERIIQIGSNPGDLIADIFCGSGTTFIAAEKTGRRWLGCDIDVDAVTISIDRLNDECGLRADQDFQVRHQELLVNSYPVIRNALQFFISHSHTDKEKFVDPFCTILKARDIPYWIDKREIEFGDKWRKKICQGLDSCDALVLFISPAAMRSPYVKEEYEAFLHADKPIFPIMCIPTPLPDDVAEFQYVDFDKHDEFIKKLMTFSG